MLETLYMDETHLPGEQWQPSNGTEGDEFIEHWCRRCSRDKAMREGADFDECDATEPAPPPEQYAICRAGQGHLSAWPLRDMTIEEARQLAIDDAAAVGGEVILYRCTAIGRAFPRIVFEEA